MRRRRNHDNYPVGDESATKSASCRKIPQVCQFYSMFPICQTAKLKSLFTYGHDSGGIPTCQAKTTLGDTNCIIEGYLFGTGVHNGLDLN